MLMAFGPEHLQSLAVPIGIGLAVLIILVVPWARRDVTKCFQEGNESGKKSRQKHPILAQVVGLVALALLIAAIIWFEFWRK